MELYEKELLNALLDKYEHSKSYVSGSPQARRILLRLYGKGKNDFPAYNIEDHAARSAINTAVQHLAQKQLITLEWMKGQEEYILHQIALRTEALPACYRTIGRTPLAIAAEQLEVQLQQAYNMVTAGWARHYLEDQLAFLHKNRRPPAALPSEAAEQRAWLTVLRQAAVARSEPILERVFSLHCLGNTKAFEKFYRGRLLRVLRQYLPMDTTEMTEEELLREIGLEKYPEIFSLAGQVQFHWRKGQTLCAAPLADGLQISARDAAMAELTFAPEVTQLLFIENKANYYDTLRNHADPRRVVVYHGGCYSPQRGTFFQKLAVAAGPDVQLLHWGDIDLGGFEMDSRLRREIDARFTPWRMGIRELEGYAAQTTNFANEYAARLEKLLEDPYLQASYATIGYMLQHRVRLEQEAMIGQEAELQHL